MAEITAKNSPKNRKKIFSKCAKPHGRSVLAFYIIDVLIAACAAKTGAISVLTIQQVIQETRGVFYPANVIQFSINNLHIYSNTITVITTKLRAGKSRALGFSIEFIKP